MTRHSARAYVHIILTSAREDSANPARLGGAVVLSFVRVALLAAIYKVAYSAAGALPLGYENAVWCLGVYMVFIMNLGLRHIFKIVDREVRTGTVEVALIKPLDWRLVKVCELLGKNGVEFLLQLILIPIALLILVGVPEVGHLTPQVIGGFVVLTALAMVTAMSMFLTIGLSAFWLNDAQSLWRLIDKVVLIFGGAVVPIALLPHAIQEAVRYSPFGVYAAPTQLFNPGISQVLWPTLIAAVVWSLILVGACQLVWRRAERRIEVNGG